MTEQVIIPASIGDAITQLEGVDRLLTAKRWERAAIVAAFVALDLPPGPKPARDVRDSVHLIGTAQFAKLGITGLRRAEEVRRYALAWQSTGRPRPRPGETVDLAGLGPWPRAESTVDAIKRNARAAAAAFADGDFRHKVLDEMPEAHVIAFVVEAIQDDASVRDAAGSAILSYGQAEDEGTGPRPRTDKPRNYGRLIESAVNNISVALAANQSGRWELTSRDEALLYFVTKLLGERLPPEGNLAELVGAKLAAGLDEVEQYANAGSPR